MSSIAKLCQQLQTDHPSFCFAVGETTAWEPATQTIHYNPSEPHAQATILHELAHALLGHTQYQRGIELLHHERDAWHHAHTTLAPKYSVTIPEQLADEALDTYRDWLHARSSCPNCTVTGVEYQTMHYKCPSCLHTWHVNDGRATQLRRYSLA